MPRATFVNAFPVDGWCMSRRLPMFLTMARVERDGDVHGAIWNPAVVQNVHALSVRHSSERRRLTAIVHLLPLGFNSPATTLEYVKPDEDGSIMSSSPIVRTGDVYLRTLYRVGRLAWRRDVSIAPLDIRSVYGYAVDKHAYRSVMGQRSRRLRVDDTVYRGRAVMKAAQLITDTMRRHSRTGELGGWRVEWKFVTASTEFATSALSGDVDLSFEGALEEFGFPSDLLLYHTIDLEAHGAYVEKLVQHALSTPTLMTFKSAHGNAQAPTDSMRKQDRGKVQDIWNAARVDHQKSMNEMYRAKNWADAFYNDYEYNGLGGAPPKASPRQVDVFRDEMKAFDAQAREELDTSTLAVYEALLHAKHPKSQKWGTRYRVGGTWMQRTLTSGGGMFLVNFATPLQTARHWRSELGDLNDKRWQERPMMLKQDAHKFTGTRVSVGGVLEVGK